MVFLFEDECNPLVERIRTLKGMHFTNRVNFEGLFYLT